MGRVTMDNAGALVALHRPGRPFHESSTQDWLDRVRPVTEIVRKSVRKRIVPESDMVHVGCEQHPAYGHVVSHLDCGGFIGGAGFGRGDELGGR